MKYFIIIGLTLFLPFLMIYHIIKSLIEGIGSGLWYGISYCKSEYKSYIKHLKEL